MEDSPLPPIAERLAHLCASRELLEFYRGKIAQFDGEHDDLMQMLEKYRGTTEDQVNCVCVGVGAGAGVHPCRQSN